MNPRRPRLTQFHRPRQPNVSWPPDSPLRGGVSPIALRLGRASFSGRAVPSVAVAVVTPRWTLSMSYHASAARGDHQPLLREVMRKVVLQETPVPGRTSSRCRSVHASHSRFAGLQRRSPFGLQLPGEMQVLPFAQAVGVSSDPRITFPYLLKNRTSTFRLCALQATASLA